MKNLITILAALTLTVSTAFATTTPEALISTESVVVVAIGQLDFFTSAEFEAETDNLSFTTDEKISVIQIFNAAGDLEFQLPVMSDIVKINKNLFGTGEYKLGFILEGQSQVHTTQVSIK
jgi:5,10-methylene-tetrahydrofolate dehydrogenase/methenyl tetrahydrofolate cyclohydrolase